MNKNPHHPQNSADKKIPENHLRSSASSADSHLYFYEREAIAGGRDKRTLERQIQSYYYERILQSRKPENMFNDGRNLPVPAKGG